MPTAAERLLGLPGLAEDLALVESELAQYVTSDDPMLTEVASHLLKAGGKRLRPALALISGRLVDGEKRATTAVRKAAAAVELVHLGSLYHDDVMDEATTRRNVESVNSRWGNLVAILAGDFLLAKASEIAAELGTEASALLARTIGSLCEGQVRELQSAFDPKRTVEAYLSSIHGKTASLLGASCRIGAIAADLDRSQIEDLTVYGENLGMVFQIVDDLLDLTATDEALGKPACNDLREGVYTLPILVALAQGASSERLGQPISHDESKAIRDEMFAYDPVGPTIQIADSYLEKARSAVPSSADPQIASALRDAPTLLLADFTRA